jgi:uncharacterized protein
VPRLGARAFEQAAGFLRVRDGGHPLDATAVHPERYALVERIAADLGASVNDLVGNHALIDSIPLGRYVDDEVGLPTLNDIADELRRPGRDPRSTFELPAFREDVTTLEDLRPGMKLDGVVTNLVAFGAFVDIGVHQDGLVHVSQLADRFVKDPADIVRVGQKVAVTVISVDLDRRRIALSMKSDTGAAVASSQRPEQRADHATGKRGPGDSDGKHGSRDKAGKRGSRDKDGKHGPVTPPPVVPRSGDIAPNGMRFR